MYITPPLLVLILRFSFGHTIDPAMHYSNAGPGGPPSQEASLHSQYTNQEDWHRPLKNQAHNDSARQLLEDTSVPCSPTSTDVSCHSFSLSDIYRYRHQRSVNLGSWFVSEEWMVPSLFNSASGPKTAEIDVASGFNAQSILENHWDTFITKTDFDYLASIGINTVRLPIGYWSLGPAFCLDTPFQGVSQVYGGSWARVMRAIEMAGKAGLGVLVDLHGAVGSQNGQAHSGISDGHISFFENTANMDKTINALVFLMEQLVHLPNVIGIQILNEPQDDPLLCDFYTEAISRMRAVSPEASNFPLYIHNAFNLPKFTSWVADRTDFVVQDHHSYFVFTPSDAAKPASQHTSDVNSRVSSELGSPVPRHNLVVDEWSCALTSQSLEPEEQKEQSIREFCQAQMDVYGKMTPGWAFWSLKTEDCEQDPAWCFYSAVKKGVLPPQFFSYNVSNPSFFLKSHGQRVLPSNSSFAPLFPYIPADLPQSILDYLTDVHDPISVPSSPEDKGFSEGFKTAKFFALHELSKLGFVGQYINDILKSGRAGIDTTNEGDCLRYQDAFLRGLKRGEEQIAQFIVTYNL
ncbi:hypothetical protein E1B28_008723 [Marasmius oreades]|uniref:Glycoside hydrolase family 5 domain-containing protein n=1 Tax=Marasmius oreades TaxID=181124 RepID=A0A9P7RYW6_9AGAR|nr:uncharacterized protein E1B28_008723 [Marasmius oreades]KAG7092364.1 hypothetical protein E1B28_008723 [Marasmius oreades]